MSASSPIPRSVDVAVGIIRDDAGRVLVNQRPAGKAFAGRWEFPGGKLEPGELVEAALSRELDEELGIEVIRQRPLISFPYRYQHSSVHLHVNEVLAFHGEPEGREGQTLDWVAPQALHRMDLLEANRAIVTAVVMPRVCLVTDTERFGIPQTLDRLAAHVATHRVLLIIREKTMPTGRLADFVRHAVSVCHSLDSMVCLHTDCALDDPDYVDGIHFPAVALDDGALPAVKGWSGVSCHTVDEIMLATRRGFDYALLSPVNPTASHRDAEPLRWPRFEAMSDSAPLPIYALGGMKLEDLEVAARHGAQGVAMLGAAWE